MGAVLRAAREADCSRAGATLRRHVPEARLRSDAIDHRHRRDADTESSASSKLILRGKIRGQDHVIPRIASVLHRGQLGLTKARPPARQLPLSRSDRRRKNRGDDRVHRVRHGAGQTVPLRHVGVSDAGEHRGCCSAVNSVSAARSAWRTKARLRHAALRRNRKGASARARSLPANPRRGADHDGEWRDARPERLLRRLHLEHRCGRNCSNSSTPASPRWSATFSPKRSGQCGPNSTHASPRSWSSSV